MPIVFRLFTRRAVYLIYSSKFVNKMADFRGVHLKAGVGNGVVSADDDDAFTPRQNRPQPGLDLVDCLCPVSRMKMEET